MKKFVLLAAGIAIGFATCLAGSATGGTGSAGTIFVTDAGKRLIRKIIPAGIVSTLAGSVQGYTDGNGGIARFENLSGPSIDAAGNIFVSDGDNNRIRKIGY